MVGTPDSDRLVVDMRGIVKRFPGVVALDHVNLQLRPGEVHVLLGENGAGKSTLIKVMSGAYTADSGEIWIDGTKASINSPQDALDRGLRFIYQELSLVRDLDIARNMFLGMEPLRVRAIRLIDEDKLYRQAKEYLEEFHIDLDPRETIRRLSVTQQKMVEIARALTTKAKVIVLDEPTDVLEDRSRRDLFDVIRQLKSEQGVSFVYISHRYAEVAEIGDRVTILRDGKNVGTYEIKDLPFDHMIELMIGGAIKKQYPDLSTPAREHALRVEHLVRAGVLDDVSLSIRKGEIVGVTGLMGAGKTELGRAIAGADRIDSGAVYIHEKRVRCTSPQKGIREGVAYLPEDRKTLGLIQGQNIRDNYALPSLDRLSALRWLVNQGRIDIEIKEFMSRLAIKAPTMYTAAQQLSGGNQQKVVVAKWLGAEAKVLIFDEPTRGIDINGKREIYRIMEELLERGVGILMLTSDYTEALEMSHRIVVMRRGAICQEFKRGEATEADILREAIGAIPTSGSQTSGSPPPGSSRSAPAG
jgi:ribose transport system ATP-binding protein